MRDAGRGGGGLVVDMGFVPKDDVARLRQIAAEERAHARRFRRLREVHSAADCEESAAFYERVAAALELVREPDERVLDGLVVMGFDFEWGEGYDNMADRILAMVRGGIAHIQNGEWQVSDSMDVAIEPVHEIAVPGVVQLPLGGLMDARKAFDADQSMAAFLNMGAGLASMFKGLLGEGMQPSQALRIVEAYARGMGGAAFGSQAPRDEDLPF